MRVLSEAQEHTSTDYPLPGSHTVSHGGAPALMGADVGSIAGIAVAEVGDRLARTRTGTARRQLETAGFGRRIEAGSCGIDRLAADPVRFLALPGSGH